jgi:ABC-2 type transport system ATP-binding protein
MNYAIETSGLGRRFGRQVAVDEVDLRVPERAVYGFLGQNGAGKTTTIRMLLGLLKPTSGTARLFGHDVRRERMAAARLAGALVETPCHYDHLTGRENLAVTARLLGAAKIEIGRVLEIVDLASAAERRVGGYSLGMRQRLGVARALIGRPKLLILDEPTNGLDPNGICDMRRLIAGLPEAEGVTVFVSSHILSEVEQTATHVGLMHRGRLLLQDTAEALRQSQSRRITIAVDRPGAVVEMLRSAEIAASVHAGAVLIEGRDAERAAPDVPAINFMLVEAGIRVSGIEVKEPSLERIFHDTLEAAALPLAA